MSDCIFNRNVIAVVQDEKSRNYLWSNNADKIDQNVRVVSVDEIEEIAEREKVTLYTGGMKPTIGMVLMRDPINHKLYYPIQEGEESSYISKIEAIRSIAQSLGASRAKAVISTTEAKKREFDAHAEGGIKALGGQADLKTQSDEKLKSLYEKEYAFSNPELTQEGYEEAVEKSKCFEYDPTIKSLLDFRRPGQVNPGKSYKVHLNLSKEFNNSSDAAFSLNYMANVFKMNVHVKEAISVVKTVDYTLEIEF